MLVPDTSPLRKSWTGVGLARVSWSHVASCSCVLHLRPRNLCALRTILHVLSIRWCYCLVLRLHSLHQLQPTTARAAHPLCLAHRAGISFLCHLSNIQCCGGSTASTPSLPYPYQSAGAAPPNSRVPYRAWLLIDVPKIDNGMVRDTSPEAIALQYRQ
jgi:hypothetical protein